MGRKARPNTPRADAGRPVPMSPAEAITRSEILYGTTAFLDLVIENIPAMVGPRQQAPTLEKVEVTADGGSRYAQLVRDAGDVHAAIPGQPLQDRLQPLRLPHRTSLRIPQAAARPGARAGPQPGPTWRRRGARLPATSPG